MPSIHLPSGRFNRLLSLLMILALSSLMTLVGSLPARAGNELGIQDQPKITMLIYPTLGNPVIAPKGSQFTIEFDPRKQDFDKSFIEITAFQVKVKSSHGPYPVTKKLPVTSFEAGYSSQWPEYKKVENEERRMYLVTVMVPEDVPHDLYDLTVKAEEKGGTWLSDTQPHAFQAIGAYKDHFSFCQLTDIHVFGPECEYPAPSCTYHLRNRRHEEFTEKDGHGAKYYHKAIQQVNLMKPDFCVFSGDYMFGQAYFTLKQLPPWDTTTEYEYEMLWFYQETLSLDVPVFMAIGNHDGYYEGDNAAKEDWFKNWRELFGPLYHSFDYDDYHFLSLNSMEWDKADRTLNDNFGVILQPTKYKGQFLGGGDPFAPGVTEERLEKIDESDFKGQLAWIRDDLEEHVDSKMRVCLTIVC